MNIRHSIAALLVLSTAACAAESAEEDADGSNAAMSTPRDSKSSESKVSELRVALDNAKPSDFGNDIATGAKPYLDDVLAYVKRSFDPKAELYSFMLRDEKTYVVEMRSTATDQRLFYVYEVVKDAGYIGGYFKKELAPKPLARCEVLNRDARVTCESVESGARIYDSPKTK